jgi:ADP-ribose pyrophosphatase
MMEEVTRSSETLYSGKVFRLERLEVEKANGQVFTRDVIRHGGAVAIVALVPEQGYLFVKQFRKSLDMVTLELSAGGIDPGESLEEAAARELEEETGYSAGRLHYLGALYPAPGYTDEKISVFYTETTDRPSRLEADHDEELEICFQSISQVEQGIRQGVIQDGKTLAGWQMFSLSTHYPDCG